VEPAEETVERSCGGSGAAWQAVEELSRRPSTAPQAPRSPLRGRRFRRIWEASMTSTSLRSSSLRPPRSQGSPCSVLAPPTCARTRTAGLGPTSSTAC